MGLFLSLVIILRFTLSFIIPTPFPSNVEFWAANALKNLRLMGLELVVYTLPSYSKLGHLGHSGLKQLTSFRAAPDSGSSA